MRPQGATSSIAQVRCSFNLWTSAHGFHHLSLSNRKVWKILWALVLTLVIGGLIAVLVYYFVYVFTYAKYSVVTLESPGTYSFHNEFSCPRIFNLLESGIFLNELEYLEK